MRLTVPHILAIAIILTLSSCRHKKQLVDSHEKKDSIEKNTGETKGTVAEKLSISNKELKNSKLYSFIDDWYGTPYKFGGCTKAGIDCSCFTSNLLDKVYGLKTGRTAGEIYKACDKIKASELRQGDLVFFIINGKNVSHVGVYLKNDLFVHSSTSRGVIISSLNEAYYKKYYYGAGRLKQPS